MENKKTIQKINVTESWFFARLIKLTDYQLDLLGRKESNKQNQK